VWNPGLVTKLAEEGQRFVQIPRTKVIDGNIGHAPVPSARTKAEDPAPIHQRRSGPTILP